MEIIRNEELSQRKKRFVLILDGFAHCAVCFAKFDCTYPIVTVMHIVKFLSQHHIFSQTNGDDSDNESQHNEPKLSAVQRLALAVKDNKYKTSTKLAPLEPLAEVKKKVGKSKMVTKSRWFYVVYCLLLICDFV